MASARGQTMSRTMAVVAREYPPRHLRSLVGARTENIRRRGCPVGLPEEGIELHEGHVERAGQPLGEGGLARARCSDHDDPTMPARHEAGIIASVDPCMPLWQDRRELERV